MSLLLRRAEAIGRQGEVPVSALVLDGHGRCIGFGRNTRERDQDPLGHAELVAIRQATVLRGDWRLNDCTLLVTLEPCPILGGFPRPQLRSSSNKLGNARSGGAGLPHVWGHGRDYHLPAITRRPVNRATSQLAA